MSKVSPSTNSQAIPTTSSPSTGLEVTISQFGSQKWKIFSEVNIKDLSSRLEFHSRAFDFIEIVCKNVFKLPRDKEVVNQLLNEVEEKDDYENAPIDAESTTNCFACTHQQKIDDSSLFSYSPRSFSPTKTGNEAFCVCFCVV
ncbi:hypothetical protein B9Z55_023416 [Caenorhabditis nigoni]|uniref:Uncharacterized protein n=1 Tax=Caenorhabditis nigoni TaxID=1611254 RepID=A0A2G5SQ29_9PELO|nr:hypothetical protein B9Z55_023416 [Caenorhabditis nigoni]